MHASSKSSSSVHRREEDESQEEDKKRVKRPRAKFHLSKRRKTKCDKLYPCSSCVSREEGDKCHYEEGYEPIQESSSSSNEYKAIQDRLDRIEAALTSHMIPQSGPDSHSLSRGRGERSTSGERSSIRASTQEMAHSVLLATRTKPSNVCSLFSQERFEEHGEPSSSKNTNDTWPNIVLATTYTRSMRWNREMQSIFDALPSQPIMEYLVNHYFSEMQLLGLHVVEVVFKHELSQFISLRALNLHFSVDPAWLALLVCILWVTSHYLTNNVELNDSEVATGLSMTKSARIDLAMRLYDALEMALNCSNWLFKPQIRILQALLVAIYLNLQGCYHNSGRLYGPPPDWSCCLWFDIAAGIGKGLELHLDPSIADITKLNDPALPITRPIYSIQLIRRILHELISLDSYAMNNSTDMSRRFFPYAFPDESILTPAPFNYSQEALMSESNPCPRSEKTSFVWALHQTFIAQEWRKIVVILNNLEEIPYSAVLERNQVLRDAFTDFLALKADGDLTQYESDLFAMTYSSYQQRFLRLHRPFFLRGYRDQQFEQSRIIVVNAARQIAKTHRRLLSERSNHSIVKSAVFMFQHHLTALPILLLNALYDNSSCTLMKQELLESSEVFLRSFQSGSQLHMHIAAKGVCIANEAIKVIDNPPTTFDNMEDILQNINIQAKANESKMIHKNHQNDNLLSQIVVPDSTPASGPVVNQQINDLTLVPNSDQNWWDLDWTLFLRDM